MLNCTEKNFLISNCTGKKLTRNLSYKFTEGKYNDSEYMIYIVIVIFSFYWFITGLLLVVHVTRVIRINHKVGIGARLRFMFGINCIRCVQK